MRPLNLREGTAAPSASRAADSVHDALRDAILNGELRPNMRLVEEDLAASLQVSRTPVREALALLAQEGLVVRSRGWAVRDHAPEEILRIIEARAAIEGVAAGLAALRIDADGVAALRDIAAQIEESAGDRPALNRLNRQLHTTLTDAAGNDLLSEFARRTHISYWNFNLSVVQPPTDDEIVNAQHRELIDLVAARDAEGAERAARAHVTRSRSIMAAALGIGLDESTPPPIRA